MKEINFYYVTLTNQVIQSSFAKNMQTYRGKLLIYGTYHHEENQSHNTKHPFMLS